MLSRGQIMLKLLEERRLRDSGNGTPSNVVNQNNDSNVVNQNNSSTVLNQNNASTVVNQINASTVANQNNEDEESLDYSVGSSDEYVASDENSDTGESSESRETNFTNAEKLNQVKRKVFEVDDDLNVSQAAAQDLNKNCRPKKKVFEIKEKTSRKRKRNPGDWKKRKSASAREKGESYLSQTGKSIEAKQVNLGMLCKENCRLKCNQNFNEDARKNIFSKYYRLDINSKNMLLFKSIILEQVKRHKVGAKKNRSYSFKYVITYGQKQIYCCKTALCSLYQFSNKKVDIIQQKLKSGESAPSPDKRGKHTQRPHKIPDNVIENVINHIKKYPAEASHYSRNVNPHKMFLSPLLNVNIMHNMYLEDCKQNKLPDIFFIKKCSYRNIFDTRFNLSFGLPRSDTCSTCDAGKGNDVHKENYRLAFAQQKRDREKALNDNKICYLTMDLQQTMPLPKLSTSKAFYLRQMWFYNFGIHTIRSSGNKALFFTWTEDVANRGSTEIASCLHTFAQIYNEHFDEKIDHLIIWSDSCAGQNKNFTMITLYQLLILKGCFKLIDHKFPEVGHSYLDSDRDFGRIEKILRKHENIYVPEQYRNIIRSSNKGTGVLNMEHHFKEIDEIAVKLHLYNKKKNVLNQKVNFRDGIKWIRVESYGSYYYKESLDEMTPFLKVDILKNGFNEVDESDITLSIVAGKKGSLSAEKISNLREQLPFVEAEYKYFYQNIVGNDEPKKKKRKTN